MDRPLPLEGVRSRIGAIRDERRKRDEKGILEFARGASHHPSASPPPLRSRTTFRSKSFVFALFTGNASTASPGANSILCSVVIVVVVVASTNDALDVHQCISIN